MFVRDWEGTIGPKGRFILDEPHPDCGWVFAGEGKPTRKLDGTCCMVDGGVLYRRLELKPNRKTGVVPDAPDGFLSIEVDAETDAVAGWQPIGDGPEDQWHRAAWEALKAKDTDSFQPDWGLPDGTYELVGPHVQGNPENVSFDYLWAHDDTDIDEPVPTDFQGLQLWLANHDVEGVVWHHPDGRMAKIKGKDFGFKREGVAAALKLTKGTL